MQGSDHDCSESIGGAQPRGTGTLECSRPAWRALPRAHPLRGLRAGSDWQASIPRWTLAGNGAHGGSSVHCATPRHERAPSARWCRGSGAKEGDRGRRTARHACCVDRDVTLSQDKPWNTQSRPFSSPSPWASSWSCKGAEATSTRGARCRAPALPGAPPGASGGPRAFRGTRSRRGPSRARASRRRRIR